MKDEKAGAMLHQQMQPRGGVAKMPSDGEALFVTESFTAHKSMPHVHEKIDFTVSVFVVHKNKVLIRKHDKYGIWIGVGGHIELDEDPNQAAIREVKEEVGLDIKLYGVKPEPEHPDKSMHLIPPRFLNRHFVKESHEHIDMIYLATSNSTDIVPEHPDDESAWLSLKELDNPKYNISWSIKLYATTALKELASK